MYAWFWWAISSWDKSPTLRWGDRERGSLTLVTDFHPSMKFGVIAWSQIDTTRSTGEFRSLSSGKTHSWQTCPQPVGQYFDFWNHCLRWSMWPPWEHPWHQTYRPFTTWWQKQQTLVKALQLLQAHPRSLRHRPQVPQEVLVWKNNRMVSYDHSEAIFNSDIKLEAEAEAVLFVFNENGSGSSFFINLEAVAEAAKKCGSGLIFQWKKLKK